MNLCPGGFVFEGSVHFIAALRLVAQSMCFLYLDFALILNLYCLIHSELDCGEIDVVSGLTLHQHPEKLPPQDTLTSWMKFKDGTPATVSLTYAAAQVKLKLVKCVYSLLGEDLFECCWN